MIRAALILLIALSVSGCIQSRLFGCDQSPSRYCPKK